MNICHNNTSSASERPSREIVLGDRAASGLNVLQLFGSDTIHQTLSKRIESKLHGVHPTGGAGGAGGASVSRDVAATGARPSAGLSLG
ncbi:hypothetical protein EVAR_46717_1 [Eumeta japonica]|uniref:Uncharacterized protein n=1 Tax=Eumeta variegata TaxID=151549 RepID=A0A4C1XDV4_EUMVA|nr:hypothetical protein EVAR_46717_1 [Eumeta japonica]